MTVGAFPNLSLTVTPFCDKACLSISLPLTSLFFCILAKILFVRYSSPVKPFIPFSPKPKPEPNASLGLVRGFVNCAGPRKRNIPPAEGAYSEGPVRLKNGKSLGSVALSGGRAIKPEVIPSGTIGPGSVLFKVFMRFLGLINPKSVGGVFDKAAL